MGARRGLAGLVGACTIVATTATASGQDESTEVARGHTGCLTHAVGDVRALAEGDEPARPCRSHETEIRLSGAIDPADLDARYVEPDELEAAVADVVSGGQDCPTGEFVTGVDEAGSLVCQALTTPPVPSTTTTTEGTGVPAAPELALGTPRAPSEIARQVQDVLDVIERLFTPADLNLPATLLNGADVALQLVASPGSSITLYASAACEPRTEYARLLDAELRTTLPDLVLDLAYPLAESAFGETLYRILRETGVVVSSDTLTLVAIVTWEGVTTFSATATNGAGTSPCSNAVTVDVG